jgi:LysM repeat protein
MSTATMSTATVTATAALADTFAVRAGSEPAGVGRITTRLTRRGRLVLLAVVLVLGAAALLIGAASVSATTSTGSAPATATIVVQPGQTLWGVAAEVAPDSDPRVVIASISKLNDLSGSIVSPGQSLVVPAS